MNYRYYRLQYHHLVSPGMGGDPPPLSTGLRCSFCGSSFNRKEHLDRHLRRHSGSKPFKCKFCDRSFSRKDSLIRHASTHVGEAGARDSSQTPVPSQRRPQACLQCSKSKRRCSGGKPCDPCKRKGVGCSFTDEQAHLVWQGSENRPVLGDEGICEEQIVTDVEALALESPHSQPFGDTTSTPQNAAFPSATMSSNNNYPSAHALTLDGVTAPLHLETDEVISTVSHQDLLQPVAPSTNSTSVSADGGTSSLDVETLRNFWNTDPMVLTNIPIQWGAEDLSIFSLADLDLVASELGPADNSTHFTHSEIRQPPPDASVSFDQGSNAGSTATGLDPPLPDDHLPPSQPRVREKGLVFPEPQPGDVDIFWAEDFSYSSRVSMKDYEAVRKFFEEQRKSESNNFPSRKALHAFVQLYYEHFDSDFPMVHPSTLGEGDDSWVLLLAMASIGCQYSQIVYREQYMTCLRELLLRAVAKNLRVAESPSIQYVQSLLLTQISLVCSGSMRLVTQMQIETNLLASFCSRLATAVGTTLNSVGVDAESRWKAWITEESRNRLAHCIFRLECLQVVLLDFPPVYHHNNLMEKLPSRERLWECQNSNAWLEEMQNCRDLSTTHSIGQPHQSYKTPPGSFAREMATLILYVDESLMSTNSSSLSLRRSVIGPSTGKGILSGSISSDILMEMPISHTIRTSVEESLETLLFDKTNGHESRGTMGPFFHTLLLLRQVSIKHLFAFAGWKATEAETEASRVYLKSWIQSHPAATRRCLWHAVTVLSIMKAKQQHNCFEPFMVLVSTLMIWVFDILGKPCDGRVWESPENGTGEGDSPPTRIDRLRTLEDIEQWAEEGHNDRILIAGIGLLRGSESSRRALMESLRILSLGTAWARLRYSVAFGITNVLQGKPPRHPEDP
ncbi:hypothetical protein BX600DRAFT_53336 [Xylariales sp. PMI_506]|nr:hypothetical protein BX600DRAFT_53336 [Xylariales sp. PMI_506]